MIFSRHRNVLLAFIVVTAWVVVYGFVLPSNPEAVRRLLWLFVLPFVEGAVFLVLLSGDAVSRARWLVGTCALSAAGIFLVLSADTDPEGTAWVWIYAVAPFLMVLTGAVVGGIGIAVTFRLRKSR